jgi:hypothetical protein
MIRMKRLTSAQRRKAFGSHIALLNKSVEELSKSPRDASAILGRSQWDASTLLMLYRNVLCNCAVEMSSQVGMSAIPHNRPELSEDDDPEQNAAREREPEHQIAEIAGP